jgi:hypothetical protein
MIGNLTSSYGGLNVADALDNMQPQYAFQMDNIIPDVDGDRVRKGFININTNPTSELIPVLRGNTQKIIATHLAELTVYDEDWTVESTKGGFSNDYWTYADFTDGAGVVHTILANGSDIPQNYTTSLVDVGYTLTGFPSLDCPLAFKNRLYFISGDWQIAYSGVQSISGQLTAFDMGSYFKKGGRLLSIANWTQDAGNGADDLLVLISTEGEVLIYSGTSPESTDWRMIGTFSITKPVGKRCWAQLGGDLIIITQRGYFPLSSVLSDLRANRAMLSQKIDGITRGRDFSKRWEIHYRPSTNWLIVNVPSDTGIYNYEQHVCNLNTNAWCRFVGMDANGWAVAGDNLYFCNGKGIWQADTGTTDDTANITFCIQKAYNNFGTPLKKQLMRVVPHYYSASNETIYKKVISDFGQGRNRIFVNREDSGINTYWDTAIWDESFWSDEVNVHTTRGSVTSKVGNYISVGYYGRVRNEFILYSTGLIIKDCNGHI